MVSRGGAVDSERDAKARTRGNAVLYTGTVPVPVDLPTVHVPFYYAPRRPRRESSPSTTSSSI